VSEKYKRRIEAGVYFELKLFDNLVHIAHASFAQAVLPAWQLNRQDLHLFRKLVNPRSEDGRARTRKWKAEQF